MLQEPITQGAVDLREVRVPDRSSGTLVSGMGNGERDNALRPKGGGEWCIDPEILGRIAAERDPGAGGVIPFDTEEERDIIFRTFTTGANRDLEDGKLDYEGFLSPLVLERYAEYMNEHRALKDGSLRESDNWQKGMPKEVYMKSMWRHFMDVWKEHRLYGDDVADIEEALCALLFNAMGYLYELRRS